jgi:hypothetical protein
VSKWWRVAIESQLDGQEIVHTLGVKDDPAGVNPPLSATDLCAEVDAWLTTHVRDMLPTGALVQTIKATEFIARSAGIPESGEKGIGLAGSGDFGGEELPRELVAWVKLGTNAAVRSGHGGYFSGPVWKRANLNDDGKTLKGGTGFMNALASMNTAILAGHDKTVLLIAEHHLSSVILSRTRLERGDANWAFDVTTATIRSAPTWLRSRGR